MLYDVTGHPLLSPKAAQLGPTELDAYARAAETVLGFTTFKAFDPATELDSYQRATDAVALQVGYQVEAGIEAFVLASQHRGGRTNHYRRGSRNFPVAHTMARKIANKLKQLRAEA